MPWYYADSGKQTGPFTDEQFQSLLSAGTVRPDTLVWRDGMETWLPFSQVAPTSSAPAPDAPPLVGDAPVQTTAPMGVVCSECGQTFPPDQVIRIADRNVCATCKPRLVQRLTEGAASSAFATDRIDEQQLLAREYRVDIGTCLERAWKVFSSNAGAIIGTTLVIGLVFIGCYAVSMVVGAFVPLGNMLLQPLFLGPLTGGMLWYALRLARGEPATMSDAFVGFTSHFVQLFLASLVQTAITVACMLPVILVGIIGGVGITALQGGNRGGSAGLGVGFMVGIFLGGLICVAAIVYVTTLWTHSMLLIIDKRMNFWPAMQLSRKMVSKSWGMTFLFVLVAGIISGAGAIACGVGIVVTVPLYLLMKAFFYDDNFRDLDSKPGARPGQMG